MYDEDKKAALVRDIDGGYGYHDALGGGDLDS